MKIRIETPGFKASPSLNLFVKEKVSKLEKFFSGIQEVEVTLFTESKGSREIVTCTLNMRIPGKDEYTKGKSSIFEDAILEAIENAKRRLRIRKTQRETARKGKK